MARLCSLSQFATTNYQTTHFEEAIGRLLILKKNLGGENALKVGSCALKVLVIQYDSGFSKEIE